MIVPEIPVFIWFGSLRFQLTNVCLSLQSSYAVCLQLRQAEQLRHTAFHLVERLYRNYRTATSHATLLQLAQQSNSTGNPTRPHNNNTASVNNTLIALTRTSTENKQHYSHYLSLTIKQPTTN